MASPLRARNLTRSTEVAARLEVAEGLWGRFMGLMGRPGLDPGTGLWLTGNGIHMMFMRFPIDAVFVGQPATGGAGAGASEGAGGRRVLSVHRDLRPWTGLVPLVRGASGVLELPVGSIERTGTAVGDEIVLEAAEAG
jgi:uncharacterized membrane protein (UPF0127 family)